MNVTALSELNIHMVAMTVKHKEPPMSSCFHFSLGIEYLLRLGKSYIFVHP